MADTKILQPAQGYIEGYLPYTFLDNENDLDATHQIGFYSWSSNRRPANAPGTGAGRGMVIGCASSNAGNKVQVMFTGDGKMHFRIGSGTSGWPSTWFSFSPD